MPRSRATCVTGWPDSCTNRTASSLNVSEYDRRVFVLMLSFDFIILPLREVSVKAREGHLVVRNSYCKRARYFLFKITAI